MSVKFADMFLADEFFSDFIDCVVQEIVVDKQQFDSFYLCGEW